MKKLFVAAAFSVLTFTAHAQENREQPPPQPQTYIEWNGFFKNMKDRIGETQNAKRLLESGEQFISWLESLDDKQIAGMSLEKLEQISDLLKDLSYLLARAAVLTPREMAELRDALKDLQVRTHDQLERIGAAINEKRGIAVPKSK